MKLSNCAKITVQSLEGKIGGLAVGNEGVILARNPFILTVAP